MENKTCSYEDCHETVNSRNDESLCVFHAPVEKKGITVEGFNELIRQRFDRKHFNYIGFVFPGNVAFYDAIHNEPWSFQYTADFSNAKFLGAANFCKANFQKDAKFEGAQFSGKADFKEAQFSGNTYFGDAHFSGDASFIAARFLGDASFSGAKFSGKANFTGVLFEGAENLDFPWGGSAIACVNFDNAIFEDEVDFSKAVFKGGQARFVKTEFAGKTAKFNGARFVGGIGYFNKAKFTCGYTAFDGSVFEKGANFKNTMFSNGGVGFWDSKFLSGGAYFWNATFSGGKVNFESAKFLGGNVEFNHAKFLGGEVKFSGAHFEDNLSIINSKFRYDMDLSFASFGAKSHFQFRSPEFVESGDNSGQTEKRYSRIFLDRIRFNPFATYFEGIRHKGQDASPNYSEAPLLIFRYCQLKDVFFANNDMSLFSFFKSSFDEARFISSRWSVQRDHILFKMFRFNRNNVIPEEEFLNDIRDHQDDENCIKDLKEKYRIEDLNHYEDVASLYRRMKTALDNTKDYQQASWFYFNEFEMKRRTLEEKIENSQPKRILFQWQPCIWIYQQFKKIFSKYILYFSYKVFAGYGEKPLWSFIWLWAFTAFLALGHMVFGLEYFEGGVVFTKYDFFGFLSEFSVGNFIKEFGRAFGYALSQAIPKNYIPYKISDLNPTNPLGIAWSILNTIVLWILIIFIAIGLKRHFRRF